MKKSGSVLTLLFLAFICRAQAPATFTVVNDALHYYLHKQLYKGNSSMQKLPEYLPNSANLNPISHCGSVFENNADIEITGLEIYTRRASWGGHIIPLHLYLCALDNNNQPAWPPIDSVVLHVKGQATPNYTLMGGDFTEPVKLNKGYAVLARNMSGVSGDSVAIPRTNAKSLTSVSAQNFQKFSDGYGYVRYGGVFYNTNSFTLAPGFGPGTDYEFLIAPRVQYTLTAGHNAPDIAPVPDSNCTRKLMNFSNTSSFHYIHRMYNLNEFSRYWHKGTGFYNTPSGGWPADSSIAWYFEPDENALPARDPRQFPCVGCNSVNWTTDLTGCYTNNSFRARLTTMTAVNRQTYFYNESFTTCFKYCSADAVSIASNDPVQKLELYPNPANDQIRIKGSSDALISIFDAQGRMVHNDKLGVNGQVETSNFAPGLYTCLVTDSSGALSKASFVIAR